MSDRATVPETLAHLTDLSQDVTGSFVLHASDDYFASADGLLRPGAPEWREGAYTGRGKWMDGWESRRRRSPGHDFVIVRLGIPGTIEGVLCDTTHFKGNAPQEISLEALEISGTTSVEELLALPVFGDAAALGERGGRAWLEILAHTPVRPDHPNVIAPTARLPRATHVRMRIHPDGGVARLRIFGHARPDPETFWGPGSVDLAAIENGGTIAAISDAFFGPPENLLLPGRGVNMGDGWETKRRRTPGSDWCVVRLARRGFVERMEIDTHFFKGNAPVAARIECADLASLAEADVSARLASTRGWETLVDTCPLAPHQRQVIVPALERGATHLRLHILPHGGVNRFRAYGHALDTPGEARAIAQMNALEPGARDAAIASFCASRGFVSALAAQLPATSVRELFTSTGRALASLGESGWLEAFAAHPRLGEAAAPAAATAQSSAWSRAEQSSLAMGAGEVLERLRAGGAAYAEKFGFEFIAFASGRGASELLGLLEERFTNDRATEIGIAGREQARITRRRIGRWLEEHGAR